VRPVARGSPLGIVLALALMVGLAVAMLGGAALVHALRTEPRNAMVLVTREIAHGMLEDNEHPLRSVRVLRRSSADYFRATHGLLVLTERRVLYVGLTPRDILDPGDELPTFERLGLAVDSSLSMETGRTRIGDLPAIVLTTPHERTVLAVADDGWPIAEEVLAEVRARQDAQRADARRQRLAREAAEAAARRPGYHVVRRREALETIARQYNTTAQRLRELNALTSNRIRAGDSILVRPGS
jgi:hypothetical protein